LKIKVGCVVEGHGEIQALPILLRRFAAEINPELVMAPEVRRVSKSQIVKTGELERILEALSRQIGRSSPILVLLDADTDCPKQLAEQLLGQCRSAHSDIAVSVVIVKSEYEVWFLASAQSLVGLDPPADAESIRDAKGWLSDRMGAGKRYSETRHQPAFTAQFSFDAARRTRSFRKLEKELRNIMRTSS
jgi:hypothetical protein